MGQDILQGLILLPALGVKSFKDLCMLCTDDADSSFKTLDLQGNKRYDGGSQQNFCSDNKGVPCWNTVPPTFFGNKPPGVRRRNAQGACFALVEPGWTC